MARKPKDAQIQNPEPIEAPTPTPSRTRKKVVLQEETVQESPKPRTRKKVEVEPASAEAPKTTTRRKKAVVAEEPAVEVKPPSSTRKKLFAATEVEAPATMPATRSKKVVAEDTPAEANPKATRTKKAESASVEKPARRKPAPKLEEEPPKPVKTKYVPPLKLSELVDEKDLEEVEEEAPKPAKRKPARAAKPKKTEQAPADWSHLNLGDNLSHIQPIWRPKSERPISAVQGEESDEAVSLEPTEVASEEPKTEKRGRNRRGRKSSEPEAKPVTVQEETTEAPAPKSEVSAVFRKRESREEQKPEPTKVEEPVVPVKERQTPPVDAPQVITREGIPVFIKNKRALAPLVFHASAMDERTLNNVLEEVKMAAENGIHTFSLLVELEVDPKAVAEAAGFAGYLMKAIVAADDEAQIMLRITFAAPTGWEKDYTEAVYRELDGAVAEPSICDDKFWGDAEECLSRLITLVRKLEVGERLVGVHLERGEWFLPEGKGYDISRAAERSFRKWLRDRYRNDAVTLRAAWFDGKVGFDNAQIPPFQRKKDDADFVRLDRKARRWVDYHLFISDVTAERIGNLAYAAKKAGDWKLLVGVSYGYTFEWSHPASGHLSLGKLLRCPDIDSIAGPPSYKTREPGGTASFPWPIDSFALNGKFAMSEEDFKTPISGRNEPDDFNPVMKTPQALESVHWRGAGSALAHAGSVCWMDSWGNGWLGSRGIWERAGKVAQSLTWRMNAPQSAPDVAVLIDERSLAYLVDERAFSALVQNVRESVLRSGLSVGFYLISDLAHRENFPESRLYVFVNAWDIRPEVRSAIKSRLQRDGKVLFWLYAAGLFEGGRESLERVREATGIALRPQPFNSKSGTTMMNLRDSLCQPLPENVMAQGGQLEPSYFAIPEDAHVLGEYSQSGLPSYVVRDFQGDAADEKWTSVFLGEPLVTPGLFRALGQMAGAHVWSHDDDVIHARAPFLTIHCTGAGQRVISLPDKWVAYDLTLGTWALVEGHSLKFSAMDGSTHSFLIGTRSDIQALLDSPTEITFSEEEINDQRDDTTHWDDVHFDVAIMKLDEWVEESWSDEMADDLLLKPSMIEIDETPIEDEEPISRGGRRRKRRHAGRDRDRRQEKGERQMGEAGISVLFRKRE